MFDYLNNMNDLTDFLNYTLARILFKDGPRAPLLYRDGIALGNVRMRQKRAKKTKKCDKCYEKWISGEGEEKKSLGDKSWQ